MPKGTEGMNRFFELIVSLILSVKGLAKACGEGGLLARYVEMCGISERAHTEISNAFSAFLGHERCNRRWSGAGSVPEHHRGDIDQMREQNALQAEMAEKHQRVLIWLHGAVVCALALVAVLFQKSIKLRAYLSVFCLHVRLLENLVLKPTILIKIASICGPAFGQPIPNAGVSLDPVLFGQGDWKFTQPVQRLARAVHLFERWHGGRLRSAEWG